VSAPDRAELLRQSSTHVGIDFVRVSDDQLSLDVFLHHRSPMPAALLNGLNALKAEQVTIKALGRGTPLQVKVVEPLPSLGLEHGRRFLRLPLAQPGGFCLYRLSIDHPAFDPFFNHLSFSFKAGCETDLDCRQEAQACPEDPAQDYPVDYRARDFWSFRQALLDFAAQRYPHWQDRLEADLGVVLVELLAALGDEFAYAQDRLARELRFGTATQRRSLAHFARLMDYRIDQGSGAQVWLDITVNAGGSLPAGTAVCDVNAQAIFEIGRGLIDAGKQFLLTAPSSFRPYVWDENATCLPAGSTSLTLQGRVRSNFLADSSLKPALDKWILLATRPTSPDQEERRLLVRVSADPIESTDPLMGNAPFTLIQWEPPTPWDLDLNLLEIRANLVPATSGQTLVRSFRVGPAAQASDEPLEAAIERVGPNGSLACPGDRVLPRPKQLYSLPGSDTTPLVWLPSAEDASVSCPELLLFRLEASNREPWEWLESLAGEASASATDKVFSLEEGSYRRVFGVERMGKIFEFKDYASSSGSTIRFGDGVFGLVPGDGSVFEVHYRLGNGQRMNVSSDTLTRFLDSERDWIDAITNPLPAQGGRDPESNDSIRTKAPEAYQAITYRAVRPEDFDEIVPRELPWVQRSGTQLRWTGSWPTVFLTPDPKDVVGLSQDHRQELERLGERIRQAGREVKVLDPEYIQLDLEIHVCVAPDAYAGEVEKAVLAALFDDQGFFDPDHFSFGTPLSRAALMAAIQAVPGVKAVQEIYVEWRGHFEQKLFKDFILPVGRNQVIQIANNPLLPERGAVTLVLEGGA
jgi:hypothetical protein